jgi:hypothetical protein
LAGAWITLLLSACAPTAPASAMPSQPIGLASASWGVCEAMAGLPDVGAARRAFVNLSHDALHSLAAQPVLERSLSARVLETMEKVESDFDRSADPTALSSDLAELHAAADAALEAVGVAAPVCPG